MRLVHLLLGVLLLLAACQPTAPTTNTPVPTGTATVATLEPTPTAAPWPTRFFPIPEGIAVTRSDDRGVIVIPEAELTLELPGANPWDISQHQPAGASEHFRFHSLDGTTPIPLAELQAEADVIYDEVAARVGAAIGGRIPVTFLPPQEGTCPVRGVASFGGPDRAGEMQILIFADEATSPQQVLGVLAHETAHLLHARTTNGMGRSVALQEGFAHWAASRAVNAWYGSASFDDLIRVYLEEGRYRPLSEVYEFYEEPPGFDDPADCLAWRDQLYTQWAAFIGFLVDTYGRPRLDQLMGSPTSEPADDGYTVQPADFQGVYGLALNQLEAQWLSQLTGGD
ncbi:MAG: hypothetical protein RRC07_09390 [Anaerolineae bacterium]|nr:hypothetical protein [Anaerolineae bacterium]